VDYLDFHQRLVAALPPGTVLQNPGGGTTAILNYTASDNLVYRRGQTRIYVSIRELCVAHQLFQGQMVSSTDLRNYAPKVFDSDHSGHSCNCTLLFLALRAMGLVDSIEGAGKRGNPFRVHLRRSVDDQR
jgi:hypothetical protein